MADISDVMDAIAAAAVGVIYPSGTAQPSAIGVPVQISQGWPLPATLDLIAAKPGQTPATPFTLISIYAVPGSTGEGGTVMDWSPGFVSMVTPGISVSLDATGTIATFAGLAVGGEIATIIANGSQPFSYACQPDDTVEVIASALALAARADFPEAAWLPGTGSLQVPSTFSLVARVGTTGVFGRKIHRQKTQIRVVVWSSNPADRTTVARAIDTAVKATVSFAMPDTSVAIITYQGTNLDDAQERAGLYRRDLIYTALYDTIEEFAGVEVTAVGLQTTPSGGATLSSTS